LPAPVHGVGPPVVATFLLLHGGLCRHWVWEVTADALTSTGHRVEAPDLPSSGPDPAALGGLRTTSRP
jgi:pimeloyl-ACP methyl ester carboxylesterase